jgi:hypothetical protein
MRIIIGLIIVAAVSTFGDWVWFELGVTHRMTAGALHGAVLLGTLGAVLGWISGRVGLGVLSGIAAGAGGAMAYYALVSMLGRGESTAAMVAAWAAVWLVLAACDGRLLRRPPRSWMEILNRGLVAAVLGGVAFWSMVGIFWSHDEERNYLMAFGAWAVAWAPGLLAVTLQEKR